MKWMIFSSLIALILAPASPCDEEDCPHKPKILSSTLYNF